MGRYYFSKRSEAEGLKRIDMVRLKQLGYLSGYSNGLIQWTDGRGEEVGSVNFYINISNENPYAHISYTQTHNTTGEKKEFDYEVKVVSTPCHYGGKRWWFICPLVKGGVPCGRRVRVLYKDGDHFGCRKCYNIAYNSQNLGGWQKSIGQTMSAPALDKFRESIKRTTYRDRLTKRYRRYLREEKKLTIAFGVVAGYFERFK
jgi:hypothetical protein